MTHRPSNLATGRTGRAPTGVQIRPLPAHRPPTDPVRVRPSRCQLPGVLNGITGIANFMFLPNDPSEVGPDSPLPCP